MIKDFHSDIKTTTLFEPVTITQLRRMIDWDKLDKQQEIGFLETLHSSLAGSQSLNPEVESKIRCQQQDVNLAKFISRTAKNRKIAKFI